MVIGACIWSGVEMFAEFKPFSLSSNSRQSVYTFTSGNDFFNSSSLLLSTSATATSLRFLLAVSELMSERAMPPAPKLACIRVSLGAAWVNRLKTIGAVSAIPMVLMALRRVNLSLLFILGFLTWWELS